MNAILIGKGDWGNKLESYINKIDTFNLLAIYGRDFNKNNIPDNTQVAFIATPLDSHFDIALQCIDSNLHIFIEKPTCKNIEQWHTLYNKSNKAHIRIYTDYIYLTSPSIRKIKESLQDIGDILHIESTLTQYGKFYDGENVMEILGVHFLSIFAYLFDDLHIISSIYSDIYNANITLRAQNCNISLRCSINDNTRSRKIHIIGTKGEIHFDMLDKAPLKIIKNSAVQEYNFDERNNINNTLSLFANIIHDDSLYITHKDLSFRILNLLQACNRF